MAEILSYDFMQRAILAVIAISVFAPILGIFLILRHQSLMSDTLSHVSLAGVALGILLGVSTTWSTVIVVTIAAVILEYLQTVYKHYMEISTAILMSLGLAIALIVTSKSDNEQPANHSSSMTHFLILRGTKGPLLPARTSMGILGPLV